MNRYDLEERKYSEEDFVFFWRHTGDPVACFSQWYPCHFVVDGTRYNCAEQFMMAEKASVFNDKEIWAEIMASDDPSVIKKLGRRVRSFDSSIWNSHCIDIVRKGNVAKFGQNPKLREILLSTGDKILVEASPYDRIWGIGLDADEPGARSPKLWKGENRLGFILMEVREVLRRKSRKNEHSLKND